jgi:catechol 2,3-dioxygenase-like lactoylglutathione lyase family enzyme
MTIRTGAVNHIALTVTDSERSRDFYVNLLGFQVLAEFDTTRILSNGGLVLAVKPASDASRAIKGDCFDENRVGLDHLSLNVASHAELENALTVFKERGIPHGEIEDLGDMGIYVLAFRDPDNIQVELSAPKN